MRDFFGAMLLVLFIVFGNESNYLFASVIFSTVAMWVAVCFAIVEGLTAIYRLVRK